MAEEYATSVKPFLLDIWSFVSLYSSTSTLFWVKVSNYFVRFKILYIGCHVKCDTSRCNEVPAYSV